ncbi:MAG: cysteine synthase A [Candidatus Marinimicrobia bacterium]|jgi:cysteine synthase A|nr:cysteine synthase A [Candidatus Neomarinimicrobiota bacterium]MCK9558915.1 cysteine synthase A [Candidatus Neomarinimicrobiota bacterium]MDD5062022.1 cysteine synthase A [Candidatus Neomarinimicrobiota bacterium]
MTIYSDILKTIGKTPLVRINKLTAGMKVEIYAKIEFFNPGGSVKDRIALNMIEDAERRGILKTGMTIIEPTSGNTGIGLAMIAAVKGYPVVFTMPETMSIERRKILRQFGARIILTPGNKGMAGAVAEAERLAQQDGYFMPQQFNNPANPEIHRKSTAHEIIEDLGDRVPDYFIAGVGTGGTLSGVGEILKKKYPAVRIVAVEPSASPVLSGGQPNPHKIQGIGAGFIPQILNLNIIDEIIQVDDESAIQTARHLATEEGILTGISAGANMLAALQIAKRSHTEQLLITIFPDTGERYLSTELFEAKNEI